MVINKMPPLQGLALQNAMFLLPKYRLSEAWSRHIIFSAIQKIVLSSIVNDKSLHKHSNPMLPE
jgi:hypothetical protein